MLKSFAKLWLRSATKAAKAQKNRNRKLVKALLAPPAVRAPRTARPGPNPPSAQSRKITVSPPLPGKWLASYYVSFADATMMGPRRLGYRLYLPASASTDLLPLVVMLHGCEQTAEQFAQGTRFNQLAESKGFAVLYPQQSLRNHSQRCWHWYDKPTQEGGGDAAMIAGMIEQVAQIYPIDRTRIYIGGLSAGASMASIIALNHPHLIAAVGMHSGTVYGAGHSRLGAVSVMQAGAGSPAMDAIEKLAVRNGLFPPMPAILIHGQEDRVVRSVNLTQSARQFRCLNRLLPSGEKPAVFKAGGKPGRKNSSHPYSMHDHYSGRKLMLRVCDIGGLAHAWSGGDCNFRFNSCAKPDATRMMWNFFSRHRRMAR